MSESSGGTVAAHNRAELHRVISKSFLLRRLGSNLTLPQFAVTRHFQARTKGAARGCPARLFHKIIDVKSCQYVKRISHIITIWPIPAVVDPDSVPKTGSYVSKGEMDFTYYNEMPLTRALIHGKT